MNLLRILVGLLRRVPFLFVELYSCPVPIGFIVLYLSGTFACSYTYHCKSANSFLPLFWVCLESSYFSPSIHEVTSWVLLKRPAPIISSSLFNFIKPSVSWFGYDSNNFGEEIYSTNVGCIPVSTGLVYLCSRLSEISCGERTRVFRSSSSFSFWLIYFSWPYSSYALTETLFLRSTQALARVRWSQ